MFSVIIPTFNNIEYLKICLNSLKKNSKFDHEIIVHINEGSDGTKKYVESVNCKYTYSDINKGVCFAYNEAAKIANTKFLVLGHDDMYFCPAWDEVFYKEISNIKENKSHFRYK